MRMISPMRRQRGFTLVELLVACALTMLIMTILASAFQTAMDSLSHLRSAGELQDRLRSASERIRQDLAAPHMEDEGLKGGKLSSLRHDLNAGRIPQAGFFRIEQSNKSVEENSTVQLRPNEYSTGATTSRLLFTVKLPGKTRQGIFAAPRLGAALGQQGLDDKHDNLVDNSSLTYGSQWGIVSWFLAPSGETTVGANPTTLFTLHRRVRVLGEVPGGTISTPSSNDYSCDATGRVNTPKDVVTGRPAVALSAADNAAVFTPIGDGSDIILSNVVSFEVKADYTPVFSTVSSVTTMYPRPAVNPATLSAYGVNNIPANGFNQDFPFDDLPRNPNLPSTNPARAFDSGLIGGGLGLTSGSETTGVQIKALQIKIRIYDPKTKNTRQVTLVQDL